MSQRSLSFRLLCGGRRGLSGLSSGLRAARRQFDARPCFLLRPHVRRRGRPHPVVRRRLSLHVRSYASTSIKLGAIALPLRELIPFIGALAILVAAQLFLKRTFIGRAILGVAQDPTALHLMGADPVRLKRIAFAISIALAGAAGALLLRARARRTVDRARVHRQGFRDCCAWRHGQPSGNVDRRGDARRD